MGTLSLQLDIEVDGDVERMAEILAGYLADADAPLFDDYGYGAWGGYDGPFVVACTVRQGSKSLASYANRVKHMEDE